MTQADGTILEARQVVTTAFHLPNQLQLFYIDAEVVEIGIGYESRDS